MYFKMWKKIFFLLLITFNAFSQEYKINLEQFRTKSKIFHGSIDGKYDITIYLKLSSFSDDHQGVYSVKGWYYYNQYKKNIPIVGIYDFSDGLTLYSLKNKTLEDQIVTFNVPGKNVWTKIDYIKSITDFEEKLTIYNEAADTKWFSKTKELKLKVFDLQDNPIVKDFAFLKLDNKTTIDLAGFSIAYDHLEIVNSTKTKLETKVLLKYKIGGNPNIQGMCGAATDSGYIILSFDAQNNLNYKDELILNDCRGSIYSEKLASAEKSKLRFKTTSSSGDKNIVKQIIVDTKSISFIKEK